MNLQQLKQEARQEFYANYEAADGTMSDAQFVMVQSLLDTLIDKVVDAVQEALKREMYLTTGDLDESFRNFRGV